MWQLRDYQSNIWEVDAIDDVERIDFMVPTNTSKIKRDGHMVLEPAEHLPKEAYEPNGQVYVKLIVRAKAGCDYLNHDTNTRSLIFFLDYNCVYFWGACDGMFTSWDNFRLNDILPRVVIDLDLIRTLRKKVEGWSLQP